MNSTPEKQSRFIEARLKSFLGDKKGIVMAVRIYMDESNTHDSGRFIAVSTAWATPEVWGAWSDEWQEKIKPLKYYHAVELHNYSGQCHGWDEKTRNDLVKRCLPVIRDHKINGAVAVFDKQKLAQLLSHRPDVSAKLNHEYFVGFIWAVTNAAKLIKKLGEDDVAFFHEHNSFETRANMHFANMMKRQGLPKATLAFGAKEQWPPLQCADIFAYEGYKQMESDPTMTKVRKPWMVINGNGILVNALQADNDLLQVLANSLIEWADTQ